MKPDENRTRIFPVIMAGGASSRLWPASGPQRPKWDLRLFRSPDDHSHKGAAQSLLENAWQRARAVAPANHCFVVTAAAQADLVRKSLPDLPKSNLLTEPEPRDTAGAVAYAAGAILSLTKKSAKASDVMFVLPGDHIIHPLKDFVHCTEAGVHLAVSMKTLVTFGIVPRKPATAYGYIHRGAPILLNQHQSTAHTFRVNQFREKPDRPTAEQYVASGEYYWNGGIFLWSLPVLMDEFQRQLPEHAAMANALSEKALPGDHASEHAWHTAVAHWFPKLKKTSIDFGIMEHAQSVSTVAADFHWDDIGSWSAVVEHLDNSSGNAIGSQTDVISVNSKSNVVLAPGKRVALVGVEGLAVIESDGQILVCKLEHDQDVKKVSEAVKKR